MTDVEEIVHEGTPFHCFKVKASRRCNGCHGFLPAKEYAWKPVRERNTGKWCNDATLCNVCVRSEQT